MRLGCFGLLVILLLAVACGGPAATPIVIYVTPPPASTAPATATPAVTSMPAVTPTPAPQTPAAPSIPAGFQMVETPAFRVLLPATWTVELSPSGGGLLEAKSPLGGTIFDVFKQTLGGKSLTNFVGEQDVQLEGIWQTDITQTETTLGGVPALRGDAVATYPTTITHTLLDAEEPVGSGTIWDLSLNTEGPTPDKALDTILSTFTYLE